MKKFTKKKFTLSQKDFVYAVSTYLRTEMARHIISLTLFLPGEGGISPLIVYHVTTSVRNRVKYAHKNVYTYVWFMSFG